MKQLYFIFCMFFMAIANGQIINFPDANFKAKLLQPGVAYGQDGDLMIDANGDGEIEVSEAAAVHWLDVSNANISDLTGISFFTHIYMLDCSHNLLTNLNIDHSIELWSLYADHNQLTSIDVNYDSQTTPGYHTTQGIDLSYNNFTSLVIEDTYALDGYNLSHNQLSSLTIINSQFSGIALDSNNLNSIQFVGGVYFGYEGAFFGSNPFSSLDFSGADFDNVCTLSIRTTHSATNPIDSFHFSNNTCPGNILYGSNSATTVDFGNFRSYTSCDPEDSGRLNIGGSLNLQNVILKNGVIHSYVTCDEGGTIFQNHALRLSISNCPNLSFFCVDEGELAAIQSSIDNLGLGNQIEVNSYCTFEPGGIFYTVNGNSKFDFNANGCDTGDLVIPNQKFTITNGSQSSTLISDDSGNYHINVGAGTHTITPILDNAANFTVSPTNLVVDFPTQSSPITQNFCFAATTPINDFDITMIPVGNARPGFDAHYKIVFKNTGNIAADGTVRLYFQDNVLDFVSSSVVPTTNTTGNLSWTFTNLMPFESRTIDVAFNLNGPMETPPMNGGEVLSFTSSVGETGAIEPFANTHLLNQITVNSFDPNDKICLEGQSLSNDFLNGYVSYRIRFENTGNAAAENIVVKDMIDITKFDIATLTPVAGSHHFYTRINGNKVEFIFENINLPSDDANNDGYVVFKIKLLPGVTENIPFSNQASIYFDYNFPIVTNTATSVIGTLGISNPDADQQFRIYPVPVKDMLHIQSMDNLEIQSIEIYNNLGQIVQKELGNQHNIEVSKLAKGSYYLKIKTNNLTSVKQFLKD